MPGQNRMGPEGRGPMTGRGLGLCGTAGHAGAGFFGRRRGRGQGYGYCYPQYTPSKEDVLAELKRQREWLDSRISSIETEAGDEA